MSSDEQNTITSMLRDRFESLEATIRSSDERVADAIKEVRKAFEDHTRMDAAYWKRLDDQDAQISLLKWLTSGGAGTAFLAWVYHTFGK